MQNAENIEKYKKLLTTKQGQNAMMVLFMIMGVLLIWSAGLVNDFGMETAANVFHQSGTICLFLFIIIMFVRVMTSDKKKEEEKDIVDEITDEINLPWIVDGVCDTNKLAAEEVACNLEYACDGCPYNAGVEKE